MAERKTVGHAGDRRDHGTAAPGVSARAREQLARDVARFLSAGGRIQEVPESLRADPPRKLRSNYGRGAI